MSNKRIATITMALLAAATLAGCNSDGGSPATPPVDNGGGTGGGGTGGGGTGGGGTGGGGTGGGGAGGTPVTVSGRAADGYLAGATVCLDIDSNMACDASEPTATTGTGGAFTLTIPEGTNAASYPIVVQVSAATVDEDTGAAVGKPYVLSAPAGESDFISPLTTAVHGMLRQNPALTLDDAVTQVKLSIGASTDVSLFEDYVAAKEDTNNTAQDEYERLHRVAQVAAKVMAENHEAIMDAAAAQGIDTVESNATLLALVTNQLVAELQGAAQAVDAAGDTFDVDTVPVQTADVTGLTQQIEAAAAVASAARVAIESLLNQGVYWIWSAAGEYEYGRVAAGSEPGRLQESWSFYDAEAGVWVTGEDTEDSYFLTATGWALASDTGSQYAVTHQADGSAMLDLDGTDFALKFSAAEVDVSGRPIKDYLGYMTHEAVMPTIDGAPAFSTGAKIYQINFIAQTDTYALDNWHDCEPQHADPDGNCNIVYGHASNTVFAPAQSFADLLYPAGAPPVGNWFSIGDGIEIRLIAGDGARGGVHITDTEAPEGEQVSLGQWEYSTVHGEQIMMLTLPPRFTERLWDSGQQILAVRGGYVRRGTFLPAGTPETFGEIQFNEAAFQDIQNNSSVY